MSCTKYWSCVYHFFTMAVVKTALKGIILESYSKYYLVNSVPGMSSFTYFEADISGICILTFFKTFARSQALES